MWKPRITGTSALLLLALPAAPARAQGVDSVLTVRAACVVFFSPARAERDSIARSEGLEIDDVLDDFQLSAGKTAVYLRRAGVPSEFTECRFVRVAISGRPPRTFDRRSIPDPVGMILSDGVQEPRVVPGRGTERDLIIAAREYFRLRDETGIPRGGTTDE